VFAAMLAHIKNKIMNKLLIVFCLLLSLNGFSQSEKEFRVLDYANYKIEVPRHCSAISKHELLDCDGTSIQWTYYDRKGMKSASEQLVNKISEQCKSKEQIEVISFGAPLKGYRFTCKQPGSQSRIIVYGVVNKQPLILNVASEDELLGISNFNDVLKSIMKVKK
jgi:hypothetical protein